MVFNNNNLLGVVGKISGGYKNLILFNYHRLEE